MPEVDLITCEDVVYELKNVTKKKLKYLDQRNLEIALLEVDRALSGINILPRENILKNLFFVPRLCLGTRRNVSIIKLRSSVTIWVTM